MQRFALLLDTLSTTPSRNGKLALLCRYFRDTPDPARGYALAALTDGVLPRLPVRRMITEIMPGRIDPVLYDMSRDFVGDTSETIALMWPAPEKKPNFVPSITDVVTTFNTLGKAELPAQIARWLDALDETGRWALLKLVMASSY